MARDRPTSHNAPWEYRFPLPELDIQSDFRTKPPHILSRSTGIDGRYTGRLKRFPGFLKRNGIPATIESAAWSMNGQSGTKFLKSFAIQRGPRDQQVVRGILFLGNDSTSDILYALYDQGAGVVANAVHTFSGTVDELDVEEDNQLLVIVGQQTVSGEKTKIERLARYTGSDSGAGWRSVAWDTNRFTKFVVTTHVADSGTTTSSYLTGEKRYGLAYRLVFPEQGYFGPVLFSTLKIDFGGAGVGYVLRDIEANPTFMDTALADVFSRCLVQTFRTIDPLSATQSENRGVLHLEAEYELPRAEGATPSSKEIAATAIWNTMGLTNGQAAQLAPVAVGDVLYVIVKHLTWTGAVHATYRRIVTAVDSGAGSLSWDQEIPSLTFWEVQRALLNERTSTNTRAVFESPTVGESPYILWGKYVSYDESVADTPRGLNDDALVVAPSLIPEEFGSFRSGNPAAKRLVNNEDLLIRVCVAEDDAEGGLDTIRWDMVDPPRKGLVNVLNRRRLPSLSEEVVSLVRAGTFSVVVLKNSLIRIHRSGSRLSIDEIHNRYGASGRWGAVAIGSNLYMVSPVGILLADLNSGQLDVFGATQHFFDETGRWRDDLADIQAAYDAQLGALIFLNPTKAEALFVWLNHGVLTHLIDVPYDWVIDGTDLSAGGVRRAVFLVSGPSGNTYEVDAARASTTRTTVDGGALTYNGLAGSGTNATTLVPPGGGSFSADMVGHYVRFFNPTTGAFTVRVKVTAFSSPNLTFASASPAPAAGDRFAVGAIPFRITAWPLYGDTERPIIDLFRVKKATSMGAVVAEMSGDTGAGNPNKVMRYQLFNRTPDVPFKEVEGTMDDAQTSATVKVFSPPGVDPVIVPGVEQWSSDLDFDLLGLVVDGTIERSRND